MKTEELLKQLSVCINDVRDKNLKEEMTSYRLNVNYCRNVRTILVFGKRKKNQNNYFFLF